MYVKHLEVCLLHSSGLFNYKLLPEKYKINELEDR